MRDLLDASVWLPLSVADHVHHARARNYWDHEAGGELLFCRVTFLALLRHLTNPVIMAGRPLAAAESWRAVETWMASPKVGMLPEPVGLEEVMGRWALQYQLRDGKWTNAYLAAFSVASGTRLVSFDADFLALPGVELLHLRA